MQILGYYISMMQVLIIDETPLFRDYFKEKISAEKVTVETSLNRRDGFTKMLSLLPDLIILDASIPFEEFIDFLEQKNKNPNSKKIPIIIFGPILEHEQIAQLRRYSIVKYFNKPIKIDAVFETVGKMLGLAIPIDTTKCSLEMHINGSIIVIEISQGLNREKLQIMRYKISEIITLNRISNPKVVLMISNLHLSFVDGGNLEMLLDSILSDSRIRDKNVKVLSNDPFTLSLIEGHPEYHEIETAPDLLQFLPSLITQPSEITDPVEQINQYILKPSETANMGSVLTSFLSDAGTSSAPDTGSADMFIKVAIVDDDKITCAVLGKAFSMRKAKIDLFKSGAEFLMATNKVVYDVVILDIFMPGMSGFDVMNALLAKKYPAIVIVYTTMSQRDAVVRAKEFGAKSYLIKPQKPESIVEKALELLDSTN